MTDSNRRDRTRSAVIRALGFLPLLLITYAAAAETRRVIIADTGGWSTTVALAALDEPESVRLTDCTRGPVLSVDIVARGSAMLRDAGRVQCDLRSSFGLLELSFSGIAESRLLFVDPRSGARSSLTVPSLDLPLDANRTQVQMRLITNDDVERTYVVVFGDPAPLKLYVYNEHGNLVQVESIEKNDFDRRHEFLFYPLRADVAAGTLILTAENTDTPPPAAVAETYYGFAVVARPAGTSAAIRLWQPVTPPESLP